MSFALSVSTSGTISFPCCSRSPFLSCQFCSPCSALCRCSDRDSYVRLAARSSLMRVNGSLPVVISRSWTGSGLRTTRVATFNCSSCRMRSSRRSCPRSIWLRAFILIFVLISRSCFRRVSASALPFCFPGRYIILKLKRESVSAQRACLSISYLFVIKYSSALWSVRIRICKGRPSSSARHCSSARMMASISLSWIS